MGSLIIVLLKLLGINVCQPSMEWLPLDQREALCLLPVLPHYVPHFRKSQSCERLARTGI